jgi:hypothetical protein
LCDLGSHRDHVYIDILILGLDQALPGCLERQLGFGDLLSVRGIRSLDLSRAGTGAQPIQCGLPVNNLLDRTLSLQFQCRDVYLGEDIPSLDGSTYLYRDLLDRATRAKAER